VINVKFDYVNKKFVVKEKFTTLCCSKIFKPGEVLEIRKHPSPNRLWVTIIEGNPINSGHNVKRSTLNRCCELKG